MIKILNYSIFTFQITITPKPRPSTAGSIFSALQKSKSKTGGNKKGAGIPEAGLKNGGFLTPEERILVQQGRMICSHQNIPAIGPRSEEVVWSYESKLMVRWIVPFDRWMNRHVSFLERSHRERI